jgi:hypothetical protein
VNSLPAIPVVMNVPVRVKSSERRGGIDELLH